MSSFEHRNALPDVLDAVHKQTVVARLNELGLHASVDMSWADIYEYTETEHDRTGDNNIFTMVQYGGMQDVGPIAHLYTSYLRLSHTDGAFYYRDELSYMSLKSRIIELSEDQYALTPAAMLFVAPGILPYALHADHFDAVTQQNKQLDLHPPVNGIRDAVIATFGDEAVDYINEPTAAAVIYALQQDASSIAIIEPNGPPYS